MSEGKFVNHPSYAQEEIRRIIKVIEKRRKKQERILFLHSMPLFFLRMSNFCQYFEILLVTCRKYPHNLGRGRYGPHCLRSASASAFRKAFLLSLDCNTFNE